VFDVYACQTQDLKVGDWALVSVIVLRPRVYSTAKHCAQPQPLSLSPRCINVCQRIVRDSLRYSGGGVYSAMDRGESFKGHICFILQETGDSFKHA